MVHGGGRLMFPVLKLNPIRLLGMPFDEYSPPAPLSEYTHDVLCERLGVTADEVGEPARREVLQTSTIIRTFWLREH